MPLLPPLRSADCSRSATRTDAAAVVGVAGGVVVPVVVVGIVVVAVA